MSGRQRLFWWGAARGLVLAGLLASLFAAWSLPDALVGLLWGLVAAPLAWIEAWGERRSRPVLAVVLAGAVALAWPAIGFLHYVYVEALYATGDVIAAFEIVRSEAKRVLLPTGSSYEQVGLLVPLAFFATSFAWAVAIRLHAWTALTGRAAAATLFALLLLVVSSLGALLLLAAAAALPALLLLVLYWVTDRAVERVLGPSSHLDGALDG